ncbi:KGGVGR-motif variant AAA ATPase [Archangium violaceum]|uniref:KGGVGR-motif variant AAA ATPase n=1 Tax=Archangium violaceum TaxID=83451 RepID=UPI0006975AC2|nr:TIR domain-containing protein [Archangium violaceum]
MSTGRVITFYSYKGGVGRTQALANIGTLLTRWGYKVLCVDWDLEAPGLDRYFHQWLQQPQNPGVVELIHAHVEERKPRWQEYVVELKLGSAGLPLHLMPAGIQDDTYKRRIQDLDWASLYEKHALGDFLEQMRDEWKESYDFVLIDSRTGITDIGGICTIQLPDQLVLLFTANHQSLEGIVDVWRSALEGRNDFAYDRGRLLALPVSTRFEQRVEYTRAQDWLKMFAEKLEPIFAEWTSKEVSVPELLNHTRIPYVPYWSFGEELPVLEEDGKDPEQISFSFETLAALLAHGLDGTDLLVRNRDSYVSAAWKVTPMQPPATQEGAYAQKPVQLFLSYSARDGQLVRQLTSHLGVLQQQGVISDWRDRAVTKGTHWRTELDVHIEEADIILVFLSADFLASDYAQGVEMKRALERQLEGKALVRPVLLRPVFWKGTPFARLPMLPSHDKPVTSYSDQDEAWADISQEINRLAQAVRTSHSASWRKENARGGAASFLHLESVFAELPKDAEAQGCPPGMAVKDVAIGPEDSVPIELSQPSEVVNLIHECTVELRGGGGAKFPHDWNSTNAFRRVLKNGLQLVDTHARFPVTKRFHFWMMLFSGDFMQRQGMEEDYIETSAVQPSPKGTLSVEWALMDIVKPLLFARNLLNRLDYQGRLAIKYRWEGLQARSLRIFNPRRAGFILGHNISRLPSWTFDLVIARDSDLYDAAYEAAQNLFWQFGWEKAMSSAVPADIRTLLEGRFPD